MRSPVASYSFHEETSVAGQAGIVWHRKLLSEVKEVKVLRSVCRVCYRSHKESRFFKQAKPGGRAEFPIRIRSRCPLKAGLAKRARVDPARGHSQNKDRSRRTGHCCGLGG